MCILSKSSIIVIGIVKIVHPMLGLFVAGYNIMSPS